MVHWSVSGSSGILISQINNNVSDYAEVVTLAEDAWAAGGTPAVVLAVLGGLGCWGGR